ncbi:hypothetical protein ALC57_10854, partial [Trachymyrmex cornetzi]
VTRILNLHLRLDDLRTVAVRPRIGEATKSALTSCGKSPARIGGWPFSPQLKCFFVIDTTTSFGLAEKFIFNGTLICKYKKCNLCVYMFSRTRIIHMWRLRNLREKKLR